MDMDKDKLYTTCSNCGKRAHVAGCVSKKCNLDNLKRHIEKLLRDVERTREAIRLVEMEPDED